MGRYSILLVENNDIVRSNLTSIIEKHQQLEIWAAVGSCVEARKELDRGQPAVLLTELGLPDGDGKEIIRELSMRGYSTKAMAITLFGDEMHVLSAIEAGAKGYLQKGTFCYEDTCDLIVQMVNGGSPISPSIARYLIAQFQVTANAPKLTPREKQILTYLTKGFKFTEIAGLLDISRHTVESHVKNIYSKLNVKSRSEAVFEATQFGLTKTSI